MNIRPTPCEPASKAQTVSGDQAGAHLLSAAIGSACLPPAAALDELRGRVQVLRDPTAPAALDELARQLPVLEGLFQHFSAAALSARRSADRHRLLRAALGAQQAHARTFALLHGLALQGKGRAAVALDLDGDADAGLDDDDDDADDLDADLDTGRRALR